MDRHVIMSFLFNIFNRSDRYKIIWRLPAVFYSIFVLFLCTTGIENLPKSIFFWDYIDIVYHFSGFCLLSFLLRVAFYTLNKDRAFKFTLLFGLIWAIMCETLQIFVPTRSFTIADLTANCGGIIIVQIIINKLSADQLSAVNHQKKLSFLPGADS
jgi:VanZ family protein